MSALDFDHGRKPITEQLAGSLIPLIELEQAEKDADAVARCHSRGLLTASMREYAIKHIVRRLEKEALKAGALNTRGRADG